MEARQMNFMVKLENITRSGNKITCTIFVEDAEQGFYAEYDCESNTMSDVVLPEGYEWCRSHIAQARYFLKSLIDKEAIPSRKTIMWY